MFVTEFLGILTISTELVFSNGGHNIPYLRRQNEVAPLPKVPGWPWGSWRILNIYAPVQLEAGDSLVLYTDGVTEAMNPAGELLREERLENILREKR